MIDGFDKVERWDRQPQVISATTDNPVAETVTAIVIDPLASNVRAHKFYRRLGFVSIGRRRFGDDDCLVHELKRQDWRSNFSEDAIAIQAETA